MGPGDVHLFHFGRLLAPTPRPEAVSRSTDLSRPLEALHHLTVPRCGVALLHLRREADQAVEPGAFEERGLPAFG